MAGRSPTDKTPRIRNVVQVCLDDNTYQKLLVESRCHHDGKVSVAARALLRESLSKSAA